MSIIGVTALVFDVFGTVVDWRSGVSRDAAKFLGSIGREDVDPHAFADAWRARYMPAMAQVISGGRPFVKLDVLHRENLEAVLAENGISAASLDDRDVDEFNRAWHRLDPWPDAVPGLARLKQRFIIAPLSNGNIALMVNMAKRAGLPWDAILGAEISQAYKPSPEAYLRTADALGLAADQVCLVAAHPGDLAAASVCGLRTAFVPRPLEYGPDGGGHAAPAGSWDIVAMDFCDLADQLGA